MIVTDLEYHLETKLVNKLDLMVTRVENTNKDALINIEGAEGEGKTNSSFAVSYYFKYKTGRDIFLFFRLQKMIDFAKKTECKIIIWDEPSLDALRTDWFKQVNKDLLRLLMTCRKKKHILIFNLTKFYKFSEYVVVDRAICLIHMYSKQERIAGRFVYIKRKNLERLYNDYTKKKLRSYKLLKSFGGSFPKFDKYFERADITIEGKPHCTLDDYERIKDISIDSIGGDKKKDDPNLKKYNELKKNIANVNFPLFNQEGLANQLGITRKTIYNWKNIDDNDTVTYE